MPKAPRKPIKLIITKESISKIEANKERWRTQRIERMPTMGRMENFELLLKNPTNNLTELERMRCDAGKRLRTQIQKLVESEDFRIMTKTRQAYRDGGDYGLRIYAPNPNLEKVPEFSLYELAMYHKEDEGTRRVSTDGIGEAYMTILDLEGPDDDGNYEDL